MPKVNKEAASLAAPQGNLFDDLQKDIPGFRLVSSLIYQRAGIHLLENPKNICLVASRLHSLVKKYDFDNYSSYVKLLEQSSETSAESREFIEALTTNTTQFFREQAHFNFLKENLAKLIAQKKKKVSREIRVWCAASSTGQEPYSILITLLEALPIGEIWDIQFLATDIDLSVLEVASRGEYKINELEGISQAIRDKYFEFKDANKTVMAIKPTIRSQIHFAKLNLIETPYNLKAGYDIIFCRNVLIYFDEKTQQRVVQNLSELLDKESGLLFLGHSEAGAAKNTKTKSIFHAVYVSKV